METFTNAGPQINRSAELIDEDTNPLPRAVMRPNAPILLDGDWSFSFDGDDAGLAEKWYEGYQYSRTAHWPGNVENYMTKGSEFEFWDEKVVAWYERSFSLPANAAGDVQQHDMLQLTFGACGYETMVWLNGKQLQTIEGEMVHFGEYTSFSYELPSVLLQDTNRLTVRIAADKNADTTRGKQESHVYKRGGIWYQTNTGATRSVWLERVGRNRLRSRVGVVSIVEDNLVRINLSTRIQDAGIYRIRLQLYSRNQESREAVATDEYTLELQPGQKQQRLMIQVPDAKLWSPDHPHLYRLVAQLISNEEHVSEIQTYIGLRKIEARGAAIYLNNRKEYLDGILYQPGIATFNEIRQHMYAMKKLGCNLVRIHIAGVDPRIYNLADKMGMLLWVEVPSPHASNSNSRKNHYNELLRMLALIESHPSIIIWSLYNEDWGAQDIATNAETRQYITEVYNFMQLAHPQFLVVDNDGWQHISFEGRLKSDLLTAHLYTPEIDRWKELLKELVAGKMNGVAAFPLVVGDPFFYRGQVPLLVSEWGGFGFPDYGGPIDDETRALQIREYKKELRKYPSIAGDVYTQATNIEDERNGLIDPATGELKVPEGLLKSYNPESF